jgi:serine/threonine protein kinase
MVLERGTLLNNRYRIVDILGQGGMGSVYRAIDENLGVEVAVKDNLFTTEEYARQFRREAIILANLRHPNLPRVTDHFVISGQGQYLVMDLIEGEDLRQRMERVGLIPEEEVITIGAAVCDALAYLGSRKPPVIHRDLKPGNVKISPQGEIYLVDFGLAKTMHDIHTTATGARAMTPGYSPPEQYGAARTDQRSDIYSLGATLFAALTNTIPEDGLARAMEQAELTPLRKINARVSRRLAGVIEKSLNVRPDDRFQTAEEFKQALLNASSNPKRKENDLAVTPAPEDRKSPASTPLAAAFGNHSGAGQMAEGLSADFSDALPDRKSKPISRAARRKNLLRWLPLIAMAVLAIVIGIYFFDSGRFYRLVLKLPIHCRHDDFCDRNTASCEPGCCCITQSNPLFHCLTNDAGHCIPQPYFDKHAYPDQDLYSASNTIRWKQANCLCIREHRQPPDFYH